MSGQNQNGLHIALTISAEDSRTVKDADQLEQTDKRPGNPTGSKSATRTAETVRGWENGHAGIGQRFSTRDKDSMTEQP
jgi:hypothetical protein